MDYIYMVFVDISVDFYFELDGCCDLLIVVGILVSRDLLNCFVDFLENGFGIVLWSVLDENI